jgi:hypothetical protein
LESGKIGEGRGKKKAFGLGKSIGRVFDQSIGERQGHFSKSGWVSGR